VFARCSHFHPLVHVWCVTPDRCVAIHRLFNTSPFSPSGRYLGLTCFLFDNHLPGSGDVIGLRLTPSLWRSRGSVGTALGFSAKPISSQHQEVSS